MPTVKLSVMLLSWITTSLSGFAMVKMTPAPYDMNLQLLIIAFAFISIIAASWLCSLPVQSQLLIFKVAPGLAIIMVNLDFNFLGRDLKVRVQSFKFSRPEWMKNKQSTLGWISNS